MSPLLLLSARMPLLAPEMRAVREEAEPLTMVPPPMAMPSLVEGLVSPGLVPLEPSAWMVP